MRRRRWWREHTGSTRWIIHLETRVSQLSRFSPTHTHTCLRTEPDNPVIQTQLITVQRGSVISDGDSLLCQGRTSRLPSHWAASHSTFPWREGRKERGRVKGGGEGGEQLVRWPPSLVKVSGYAAAGLEGRLPVVDASVTAPFNHCRRNSNDLAAHCSYRPPHPPTHPACHSPIHQT